MTTSCSKKNHVSIIQWSLTLFILFQVSSGLALKSLGLHRDLVSDEWKLLYLSYNVVSAWLSHVRCSVSLYHCHSGLLQPIWKLVWCVCVCVFVCVCVCVCIHTYVCSYSQILTDCVNRQTASTHHSVTCTQNIFNPWVRHTHISKLYVFTFACSRKSLGENYEIRPRPAEFSTFIILEPHVC